LAAAGSIFALGTSAARLDHSRGDFVRRPERQHRLVSSRLALVALVLTLWANPKSASAADLASPQAWRWNPAWSDAGVWDYALSAMGFSALGVEVIFLQPRRPPLHWNETILFDEAVRSALNGSTPAVRTDAENASWALFGIELGYPVVVDLPYVWLRYGRQVAWDLFWEDAMVLSLTGAVDLALRDSIGRARPRTSDCLAQGQNDCLVDTESTRSFPGGHFAQTTAAATLTCLQHLSLGLYGGPWDAVTCGVALTGDAAVGVLRIVSDNHWATDVVAGGAIGAAFGVGLPILVHRVRWNSRATGRLVPIVLPIVLANGAELRVVGTL
jgi:membrane-associated phospholipid phosphatase